jgi:hypothetical protein
MATTRPFAYNPSLTPIAGTEQVGTIAIGVSASSYSTAATGVNWWMGPDEDSGYVIAKPLPSGSQPFNPSIGVTGANVGFSRSSSLTEASFVTLANNIAAGASSWGPTGGANAKAWLNANGYWTSFLPYVAGLFKTTYSGYFNDDVNFFATATPASIGGNPATSVQATFIFEPAQDDGSNFSCQWLGYFKPTTTEMYTFYTNSDDASYVWVGENAISGFTTGNVIVNNGGLHGMQEAYGGFILTAGNYYPIRIQFGELSGGDEMSFSFSTPTINQTNDVTGLVFYNPSTNGF